MINHCSYTGPERLGAAVKASLAEWRAQANVRRLWARDASLWSGKDEAQWLGWLGITNDQLAHLQRLLSVREAVKTAGFADVLLLGMGGSSLGRKRSEPRSGGSMAFRNFTSSIRPTRPR